MKFEHRDSNHNLITYEQRGVRFYVSPDGDKWPIVEQYEDWRQRELMDSFHQSRFDKCPDEYRGVVYLKQTDKYDKKTRFYIDEQYDGFAVTIFEGISSKRYSAQTVVYDTQIKKISIYYSVEKINANQEIENSHWTGYDIDCSNFGRMTDKKILDTAISSFNEKFLKEGTIINLMEMLK